MFFKGSRYEKVVTRQYAAPDGTISNYKALRVLPRPEALMSHIVDDGERPDQVSYRYYRDSEKFWHLADADVIVDPRDLTATPGRAIPIPPVGG
jgi:hypothetical protein